MDMSKATQDDEKVSITLMERGSQWPGRVELVAAASFENIVMAQGVGETPEAFLGRATRRLADVHASGHHLQSATLVVSRAPGSPIVHSRLAMILGESLPKGGKLTLVGDDRLTAEDRADLGSVAATLSEYFGADGPGVRLLLAPYRDAAPRAPAN